MPRKTPIQPKSEGRVMHLPPDLVRHAESYDAQAIPRLWGHDFMKIQMLHDMGYTGKGIKIGVGDTGYRRHPLLPEPLAARDFTGSRSGITDNNGHGCISADDRILTSMCGDQRIEDVFNRCDSITHFMPDGSIIKDVSRLGIKTLSWDGEKISRKAVLAVHKLEHSGDIYEVSCGKDTLRLTPWHPVYVVTSQRGQNASIEKRRADELKEGDYILCSADNEGVSDDVLTLPWKTEFVCDKCGYSARKGLRKRCRGCNKTNWHSGPTHQSVKLDSDLAYLLGLIVTDGHVSKSGDYVEFCGVDQRICDEFENLISKIFGLKCSTYGPTEKRNIFRKRVFSKTLNAFLNSLGIKSGCKTYSVGIPELVTKSPKSVVGSFVAGVIEGDGSICKRTGRVRVISGSEKFSNDLKSLLSFYGVKCSLVVTNPTTSFSTPDSIVFVTRLGTAPWVASKLRIKRWKPQALKAAFRKRSITKIAKSAVKETLYDLTVEGSHNYLANGFVVSNTHCAGIALGRRDETGKSLGVAPDAELIVAKVLGDSGSGSTTGINRGRVWMSEQGADVISESLGDGGGPRIPEDIRAFEEAYENGVSICCAALGNAGFQGVGRPGSYYENCGVAALRENGQRADFSSVGDPADLALPGQNIISCGLNNNLVSMSGTCVAEGEFVYTPDGPCPIEDITPGDVVYAYADGNRVERVVTAAWSRGTNSVLNLSASGRSVKVTETHEMLCVDTKQKDLEWVRAKDLNPERHRLVVPRELPHRTNPYLDSVVSEEFAYLLGYMLGDGWISKTTGGRRLCIAEDGKEHVRTKVLDMYRNFSGKSLGRAGSGRWYYDDNTRLSLLFEIAGLSGTSHTKTLPYWVWHISESKQDKFLQGYWDADAHCKQKAQHLETVSGDLVRKIAAFSDYRGWKRGMVRSRVRGLKAPNSKRPTWNRTYTLNMYPYLEMGSYHSCIFGNTSKAAKKMMDMGLNPLHYSTGSIRIDEVPDTVPVYDLTVPGADNFVTGGLVTHNSMSTPFCAGLLAVLLQYLQENGYKRPMGWREWREFWSNPEFAHDAGPDGHDPQYGWGIPSVEKIVDWMIQPKGV